MYGRKRKKINQLEQDVNYLNKELLKEILKNCLKSVWLSR